MEMFVVIGPFTLIDEFYIHLHEKLRKDADEFMKATNEEDELQIVLRGHIYIEHEIERLLRNHLVEPDAILSNRFTFMSKLNLAVALGLISMDKKIPYKILNDLRNDYAHELNYKMTGKALRGLVQSMDKEIRGDVFKREWNEKREMSDEKRDLLKLKRAMLSLWVYASKLVHTLSINEYEKRIDEIEARYIESDDDKFKKDCEAECMELLNKMKRELDITEKSIFDVEAPIGS
ncbi:hypothetical protein [Bacillus pseudomycoides]|uniref:hypothetical protein n=2 Tax=Bacillus pseudomycoides TaxID=64104 RepID=UPI00211D2CFE|nr:hypothetical protein [Bacillus pseudomycoides]